MAIRFDAGYNANIRKIVANYNQRRKRMERAGIKNIPEPALVSELKGRYTVKSDLNRELERLKNFGRSDVLETIETSGGVKAVKWKVQYLKNNVKNARNYFEREYERVSKRTAKFPGERQYLDNIKAKINLLDRNINFMDQADFRSAVSSVNEFAMSPTMRKAQYRGFLSEVDWVMEKLGRDDEERTKFFNKFHKLTPSQFLYMYDNNDIIAKIYRLYHKDYGEEEARLTDSTTNADELIDELMEQANVMIKDAQDNAD